MITQMRIGTFQNRSFEYLRPRFFLSVLAFLILLIGVSAIDEFSKSAADRSDLLAWAYLVGLGFSFICAYLLFERERVYNVTYAIMVMCGVLMFIQPQPIPFIALATVLIVAVAIFGNNGVLLVAMAAVLFKVVDFRTSLDDTGEAFLSDKNAILLAIAFVGGSIILRYFTLGAQGITSKASRIVVLLQAASEIGQVTNKLLDLDKLFDRSVELIRDRFAYYHVQVFLLDEHREYADLVASTGDVGKQLIRRGHRLAVGSQSVIGRVTQVGEPVIARDTDTDATHARNELLPDTRSELALPIIDGDRIIGALDVQSTRSNAFSDEDIQALQIMANQLAVAIRNARLFESKESSIEENKRLFLESKANLREIQRLNQQLTQRAWGDYLRGNNRVTGVTVDQERIETNAQWTENMIAAQKDQKAIHRQLGNKQIIAVPIHLRGEIIGALEVETSETLRINDIVDMLKTVSERLAISLDNSRLFEEAQETTAQEQRINDIVRRYQSADTVDDLLEITLSELSNTFGAKHSKIRLTTNRQGDPKNNGHHYQNGHHQDGEHE